MKFGLAIDIGTTSVVTTLMELESGEQLASVSSLNPQAVFGGDLMSRIAFAQFDPGNLRKLQTRIVGLLNQHIEQICRESGVLAKWIYKVVVVGNTCMHHILLGIDPSYVGPRPLRAGDAPPADPARARALPQGRPRGARVPAAPSWPASSAPTRWRWRSPPASTRRPRSAIAVDIGTNGEVLLGSRERLWACSAPAGPALEGAQIRHGMRAALGRHRPRRRRRRRPPRCTRIGEARRAGHLRLRARRRGRRAARRGRHRLDRAHRRGRPRPAARRRCARACQMRGEERLVDPRAPGRGAAPSGRSCSPRTTSGRCSSARAPSPPAWPCCSTSPASARRQVAELMLAGGFGNYLSVRERAAHRPHPRRCREARIRYVGNAAALGAQLALRLRDRARARRGDRAAHRARLARRPPRLRGHLRGLHELPPRPSPLRDGRVRLAPMRIPPPSSASRWARVEHEIDARWLMAYAAALGERATRVLRHHAAGRRPRPPALPGLLRVAARAGRAGQGAVATSVAVRGVHATHDLALHRAAARGRPAQHHRHASSRSSAAPRRRLSSSLRIETVDADGPRR